MERLDRRIPSLFSSIYIRLILLILLLVSGFSAFAEQVNSKSYRKELESIVKAQAQQSFEGKLVYSRPNYKIETYIHQQIAGDGQVKQWIRMLGSEEGFFNVNGKIQCITKGYKNKFRINSILQSIKVSDLDGLLKDYSVSSGNGFTVAGRETEELVFISKDKDRYIYKLAFDKLTHFPLAFVFLDDQDRVLEQASFTEFKPLLPEDMHVASLKHCVAVSYADNDGEKKGLWSVSMLPNGFTLVQINSNSKLQDEHQVYSDGLVSFSVFIEPLLNEHLDGIKRNLGATVFVSHQLVDLKTKNKYLVTVVGEIPLATAERIISSVHIK